MTACLGKSLIGLLCVSFVYVYNFCLCPLPFSFEGGMWDVIVLLPDNYLTVYFYIEKKLR